MVDVEDVIYLYCYGNERAKGKPYGILLDTSSKHEFTEEAIVYLTNSSEIHNILSIAYISKDLISKIRLNLLMIFERPPVRPKLFANEFEASEWLQEQMKVNEMTDLM